MTRHRGQSSSEFKEAAVRMVLEGERTVASVAREFGINPTTLGSRVNRHRIVYGEAEQPASATAQRRALPATLVCEVFAGPHETYGYRRVHAALLRRGEHCSAEPVRALLRERDLLAAQTRAFRPTTTVRGDFHSVPDLVRRDCTAERPSGRAPSSSATSPHGRATEDRAGCRSSCRRVTTQTSPTLFEVFM
ncbi:IS3 family transposase [Streptosporangium canum]|uniref:IS3 family transposase n=1 Tax=Streptosporangium canum TaxID=324952 RepID=UPI0037AA4337